MNEWNTLGKVEECFGGLARVKDMDLVGNMIHYSYEWFKPHHNNPVHGYRKLSIEQLKEFKEWLSQNNK